MPEPANPRLYKKILETVKASSEVWPSAYASGRVVRLYKKAMADLGREPYVGKPSKELEKAIKAQKTRETPREAQKSNMKKISK